MPIPTIETHSIVTERSTADLHTPKLMKAQKLVDFSTPTTQLSSSSEYSITSSSASSSSDSVSSDDQSDIQELTVTGEHTQRRSVVVTEHRLQELAGKHKPEPLLEENPGRFVLFPIQNPEVCLCCSVKFQILCTDLTFQFVVMNRYGTCTRRLKHHFGPQRK